MKDVFLIIGVVTIVVMAGGLAGGIAGLIEVWFDERRRRNQVLFRCCAYSELCAEEDGKAPDCVSCKSMEAV